MSGAKESVLSEVLANAAARLASYKVPERLAIVDEFPRNALSKLDRKMLQTMASDIAGRLLIEAAPRSVRNRKSGGFGAPAGTGSPFRTTSHANKNHACRRHLSPACQVENLQAREISVMQNLIRTLALVALFGSRGAVAQTISAARSSTGLAAAGIASSTQQLRLVDNAPVGHRQPHVRDVPSENTGDLEHIGEEDAAVDRKLKICRGC